MDRDRIRQKLKETPLITALRLYNTNPSNWIVPTKDSYGHSKLMKMIPSKKKKKKDEYDEEAVQDVYRKAQNLGYIGYV